MLKKGWYRIIIPTTPRRCAGSYLLYVESLNAVGLMAHLPEDEIGGNAIFTVYEHTFSDPRSLWLFNDEVMFCHA